MQLVRYDPFSELQKMEKDLDNMWSKSWGMLPTFEVTPMDLYEEKGQLIAQVSLPNFKKNEVKVKTEERILEVSAEHKQEEKKKDKRHYFFRESVNEYFRRVKLPDGVDTEKAVADFKDGVLKISMPMNTAKQLAKEVEVK